MYNAADLVRQRGGEWMFRFIKNIELMIFSENNEI